jgi:hypothetical protein
VCCSVLAKLHDLFCFDERSENWAMFLGGFTKNCGFFELNPVCKKGGEFMVFMHDLICFDER